MISVASTTHASNTQAIRIVVIGAGYAGLMATNRFLGSLTDQERQRITLIVVNPRDVFVDRIRLHQLAAGSRDTVTTELDDLLHRDAIVINGRAHVVDPEGRTVRVAMAGRKIDLAYDYLVYSAGSVADPTLPGATQNAWCIGNYDEARSAAEAIDAGGPDVRIAVVGGGFTGVEAASEVADRHPDAAVSLFCATDLLPGMRPVARRSVARTLRRLGVCVEEHSPIEEVEQGKLRLRDGRLHAFDVCVVATSFAVPDLAERSGLATDGAGRLQVDEHLRSRSHPSVIGAGDAVVAPDEVAGHLRMGCVTALPMGGQAAETLLALVRGKPLPVISIGFLIQCLSLGRKAAYVQVVRPDDRPRAFHVGGRPAAAIKEMVSAMVVKAPRKESAKPGTYSWPKGP
jgi:NADH dehydrogenase